jgi:hypothetical protein
MNQQSTLIGLFKETYGSDIVEAWGFMAQLAKRIKFVEQELQPGNLYHQPIDLTLEHGISYAAAGTTIGTGTSVFFPATAGQMQDAQIAGAQILGRALVSYEAIARSANSKAAFKSATQHVVRRLSQAALKRLEIGILHGTKGIGIVKTVGSESGSSGAYKTTLTLTDATWSTGLWAGMVGAFIDLYQSDLSTARQAANINTGVVSGASGWCRVSGVDPANKTVELNYGTTASGWVANDVLFFGSAVGGTSTTEAPGIDAISAISSSSGTFWNIPTGTYDLHRGNQYASGGVLSFGKLLEADGILANYNLVRDVVAIIPTKAYEVMNTDMAALRQFDASYAESKAKAGTKTLTFVGQTGLIELMPHPFQKDGSAHIIVPEEFIRVGASDISFITRHGDGDKLILESSSSAGSEMRIYSNQAPFCESLRHTVNISGITY